MKVKCNVGSQVWFGECEKDEKRGFCFAKEKKAHNPNTFRFSIDYSEPTDNENLNVDIKSFLHMRRLQNYNRHKTEIACQTNYSRYEYE